MKIFPHMTEKMVILIISIKKTRNKYPRTIGHYRYFLFVEKFLERLMFIEMFNILLKMNLSHQKRLVLNQLTVAPIR